MSKILHDVINSRYKERVNELVEMGIIEIKDRYWAGIISKRYRFQPKYRNQSLKAVIINDPKIIERVNDHRRRKTEAIQKPEHSFLFRNLMEIEINYEDAIKYVDENVNEETKKSIYKIMINNIKEIKYKYYWECSTTGRIYNNITNLPRKIRKFLRWQKNPLVEVDIANSQPLLFNIPIQRYINKDIQESDISLSLDIATYVTTFSDIKHYEDLTTKGIFYDYLMDYFVRGIEPSDYLLDDLGIDEPRDVFKTRFYARVFFCKESNFWTTNEREQFKKLFPNVAQIVSYYKQDNHKNLANILQQAEAEIIIGKVIPRIAEKNIYALTIHDSILTLEESAETVRDIIVDEFKNQYGLTPTVKIKKGEE
jgi:uncharacterized protein (UPF0305 family)